MVHEISDADGVRKIVNVDKRGHILDTMLANLELGRLFNDVYTLSLG